MLEVILEYKSYESDYEIYMRGQAFKKQLKHYLEINPLPAGEKMGIICHSRFMTTQTCTHCEGTDENAEMKGYIWSNNC